LIRIYVSMAN